MDNVSDDIKYDCLLPFNYTVLHSNTVKMRSSISIVSMYHMIRRVSFKYDCIQLGTKFESRNVNNSFRLQNFNCIRRISTGIPQINNQEEILAKGLKLVENPTSIVRGIRILREVARANYVPAQCALGRILLDESRKDSKTEPNKDLFTQELIPTLDPAGLPTGGSSNAADTKIQILRIRQKRKLQDDDLPKDVEGVRWLDTASKNGSMDANVALANAWFEGDEFRDILSAEAKLSDDGALSLLQTAAEHGHPDALFNLGMMYYNGMHVNADGKTALKYFEKAAFEARDPSAMFWVGQYYMHGDPSIEQESQCDPDKGLSLVLEAVQMGHAPAQVFAALYASEHGDDAQAKIFLDLALAQEDSEALYLCGSLHMQPEGSFYGNASVDYPAALRYFERAGLCDHADALCNAGALHFQGLGTPVNKFEAYRCYEQAARCGSIEAYRNIASMHYFGDGPFEKNEEAAKEILRAIESLENR